MKIVITSYYGSIVIPNTETVAIYTSEAEFLGIDKNEDFMIANDLIIETANQRFTFKKLHLAYDALLEINAKIEAHCATGCNFLYIDLNKLLEFVEINLLGVEKRLVIEDKKNNCMI